MRLNLSQAELKRDQLDAKLQRKILKLYKDAAKDISKRIESLPKTPSSELQKEQLKILQKQINAAYADLYSTVDSQIQTDMKAVIKGVLDANKEFLESLGLPAEGAFTNVPTEIIESIISGKLYDGNWSLSKAIWGNKKKTQSDVESIIAKGIADNLSAYDIGKALEQYVDPTAKKDWEWSKVYPGTNKKIDYNAQRLARTMVSHAYQQAFVKTTKDNPFVTKYRWRSAGGERTCEICKERNGKLYDKDKLPLDHPNGRCTFVAEIPDSMEDIADQLAGWAKGGSNPGIDNWYKSVYGKEPPAVNALKKEVQSKKKSSVVSGKNILNSWSRRESEFQFEIEDVINAQGFDGLPRVVGKDEFEQFVKQSKFIAQRTYSASSEEILETYREQLYSGKWYVDCSTGGAQYGQGMYCAADWDGNLSDGIKSEMKHYQELNKQKGNSFSYTETFTLDESAKIIKFEDAVNLTADKYAKDETNRLFELGSVYSEEEGLEIDFDNVDRSLFEESVKLRFKISQAKDFDTSASLSKEIDELIEKSDKATKKAIKRFGLLDDIRTEYEKYNVGSISVLHGYDAINAEGHGESGSYTVILNRTKLIIKRDE